MRPEPHAKKLLGVYLITWLIAGAAAHFPSMSVPVWVQAVLWGIGLVCLCVATFKMHRYGQWQASQS